jgi:lipopolysaccharide export LptBFGC system permease protein LptF
MDGKFTGTLYSLLVFILYYILMAATENIGRIVGLHVAATAFLPDAVIVAIGIYLLKDINKEERPTIQDKIMYFWKLCFEKTR